MKKIHIISTGGTISAQTTQTNTVDLGQISMTSLFAHLQIPADHELVFHDIAAIDSSLMSFEILYQITTCINSIFQDRESCGVIVTHGTDTLEESAYFLSLCYPQAEKRPVIITGSQRSSDELGSDALANIQHALWAVCSPAAQHMGVMVLFNQALLMPKYVHKSHTFFLQAFQTAQYGILGTVDKGKVSFVQRPAKQEYFTICQLPFPKIDIYKASLDCSGDILKIYNDLNYQAIIIEAFGRGNVTQELAKNIKDLIHSGCYVVITSDCTSGSIAPLYNFSGGLPRLIEYGAIPAFEYSAKKARIKLAVMLASGIKDKDEIAKYFQE